MYYFETLQSIENFPEEGLDDKFWFNTAAVTHPPTLHLSHMADNDIHVHGAAFTQSMQTKVGKEDLVLQISIGDLRFDC